MLFNSYIFIFVFLPLALLLYFGFYRLKLGWAARFSLFLMSLWFYGYFNPSYIPIICVSILLNYAVAKLLLSERLSGKTGLRRLVMALGVSGNLAVLFYFKYFDFFIENINHLFKTDYQLMNIVLPLGISFFTFQQISYVIDSYKGETKGYSLLDYAVFVAFFPQLVAGPIVMHSELIPQLKDEKRHRLDSDYLAKGIWIFVGGLAKKVLLADTLGKMVSLGYGGIELMTSSDVILVAVCYTLQIYFDFSGYSDMAQGIAHMFHMTLPVNFDSPYKGASLKEYWDRWHLTLTRFLRQYIYFPLGGSRKGIFVTCLNIMIVYLLSGLWHGANWTFILWGAMHGAGMVLLRLFGKFWDKILLPIRWLLNFTVLCTGFILFRSDSLEQAYILLRKVVRLESFSVTPLMWQGLDLPEVLHLERVLGLDTFVEAIPWIHVALFLLAAFLIVLIPQNLQKKEFKITAFSSIKTAVLLVWCVLSLSGVSTFLYFNF